MHCITDNRINYAFSVVKHSKPERWLTPVLIVSVGVFVLLTSSTVAIFYRKKKRTHRGTERNLPMVESEMKACKL